ncbi:arginine deiminase family protein [Hoeflea alexandrii]|jgi:N-dimethylarginine dimethylaminohydrolase|uniref:dimethylarginine dimethylaminohydrolase family protein n=1 Tax=Hoeflea alexandrii TaxID=288436 RepID=UPI0035CFDB64
MTPPLKRVIMRAPGDSLRQAKAEDWHYGPGFDGNRAIEQFGIFAGLVSASGTEIIWIEDSGDGLADAMFTHDPSLVTDKGAVILRMGKPGRMAEPDLHEAAYKAAGIPILGRIEAPGSVEGGDCVWVDATTLAVGRGVRTNQAGIEQLGEILAPLGVSVLGFDLPLGNGADACLHLMSVVSPLAEKLALVYAPMLPVAFWQLLKDRGYTLVEAPDDEFAASNGLNLNVLALTPGEVIMVDGFSKTRVLMEQAGCKVTSFNADALCIPCEGGPTCLTRPVWRE